MKRLASIPVCLLCVVLVSGSKVGAQVADLEDLTLSGAGTFYNGADNAGGFTSGGAFFNNSFTDFGGFTVWEGWSYSNVTNVATPGFGNQYSAYHLPGGGGDQSGQYAVAFTDAPGIARIELPPGAVPESAGITNTTFAALSMLNGDSFAKKFGGATGNDPDFFKLTITGLDALETPVGSVDFYLADYRFGNNALDFVVDEWTTVDLTSLAGATTLSFGLESSDVGPFGTNTPAYLALDNLTWTTAAVPEAGSLILAGLGGLILAGHVLAIRSRRRRSRSLRRHAEEGAPLIVAAMLAFGWINVAHAGPFAEPPGTPGPDAISKDSPMLVGWATGFQDLIRGPQDLSDPTSSPASFGCYGIGNSRCGTASLSSVTSWRTKARSTRALRSRPTHAAPRTAIRSGSRGSNCRIALGSRDPAKATGTSDACSLRHSRSTASIGSQSSSALPSFFQVSISSAPQNELFDRAMSATRSGRGALARCQSA